MLKPICVFDFETDSPNPNTCNPVELACVMINPHTLEIIPGSEFNSNIKPEGIDNLDEYLTEERLGTIQWHCKLRGCTQEQLLEKWKNSPQVNVVWPLFVEHVEKYNSGKTQYDAPLAGGINIINFDIPIANRLNEKLGIKRLFNHEIIDLRHMAYYLLIWDTSLKSRSMDSLRNYFGLPSSNAHVALDDVYDEAKLICRIMQYFKSGFRKDKFRNSFKDS